MPVISFRPSREEEEGIERTRRIHGFKTRAEAVRYLIRRGVLKETGWKDDPLYNFQVEGVVDPDEDLTARDIDRALYGWD